MGAAARQAMCQARPLFAAGDVCGGASHLGGCPHSYPSCPCALPPLPGGATSASWGSTASTTSSTVRRRARLEGNEGAARRVASSAPAVQGRGSAAALQGGERLPLVPSYPPAPQPSSTTPRSSPWTGAAPFGIPTPRGCPRPSGTAPRSRASRLGAGAARGSGEGGGGWWSSALGAVGCTRCRGVNWGGGCAHSAAISRRGHLPARPFHRPALPPHCPLTGLLPLGPSLGPQVHRCRDGAAVAVRQHPL